MSHLHHPYNSALNGQQPNHLSEYRPSASSSSTPNESSSGKAKKEDKDRVAILKGGGGNMKESPVKAACLNCRSKKAKCDGVKPVCGACEKKSLDCQYVKSRRGGARKKREVPPPSALQEYLKKLDGLLGIPDFQVSPGRRDPTDDITNIVRQFESRNEIFRCYYNEVHPFMPVMPPRKFLDQILTTLLPQSPFLLAAQAIMVLVPHPQDPQPNSADSKRLRSAASEALAQEATSAIERLVELRQTSLECVQALTMLSLWEWGHSGSTSKNRARTGHATQLAMEMGLHDMDKYTHGEKNRALEGENWQKDMARRTWWMTYVNQLISAMITGSPPVLGPDDDRIHVDYPVCSIDDESWPRWINANQKCSRVFGIVNTVYYSHLMPDGGVAAWGSRIEDASAEVKEKMRKEIFDVDAQISEIIKEAEETAIIELVPGGEEEVVRNQQLSARLGLAVVHIHIHRHQAFPEVSLFSKMICGLPVMPTEPAQPAPVPAPAQVSQVPMLASGSFLTTTDYTGGTGSMPSSGGPSPTSAQNNDYDMSFDFTDDMWQPETFPDSLPDPWFTRHGGAGSLYAPVGNSPFYAPLEAASIASYHSPPEGEDSDTRRPSTVSPASPKPHKAWGVDANDKPEAAASPAANDGPPELFPPGVSLARCATAAHTIIRLEVLHRSAVIAMWDGPPKWMPFCACGLVTGAYSFLLLALAVQAESAYQVPSDEALEQIEGLLTNVKVIVAGLEAYGQMWAGIEVMASEVRAALEAATRLPYEIRKQIAAAQVSPIASSTDFSSAEQQMNATAYDYPIDPNIYPNVKPHANYQYDTQPYLDLTYAQPDFVPNGNGYMNMAKSVDTVNTNTINGLAALTDQMRFQELSPPDSNTSASDGGYVMVGGNDHQAQYKGYAGNSDHDGGHGLYAQDHPGIALNVGLNGVNDGSHHNPLTGGWTGA